MERHYVGGASHAICNVGLGWVSRKEPNSPRREHRVPGHDACAPMLLLREVDACRAKVSGFVLAVNVLSVNGDSRTMIQA